MITGRWAFAGQVNSSLGALDDHECRLVCGVCFPCSAVINGIEGEHTSDYFLCEQRNDIMRIRRPGGRTCLPFHVRQQIWARGNRIVMPDIVNLIIWLVAGIAGGNAAGDLLKGHYDLGLRNTGYGAIGGVVGALILQTLIPALRGIDYGPITGQLIVAAASGAVLTVIAGAVGRWRQNG